MPTVYIPLVANVLQARHLNIIKLGRELGDVTIGLLTDRAVAPHRRLPLVTYDQRLAIVREIKGVHRVVPQHTLDASDNLRTLRPDVFIHSDDGVTAPARIRSNAVEVLKAWGGRVVDYPPSDSSVDEGAAGLRRDAGMTPHARIGMLRRLLAAKPLVRALEAHNGLTGLIVENASVAEDGSREEFDAIWISSLTDSVAKGRQDIEYVDVTSRLATVQHVLEVTTKPLVYDGDTGGAPEHFALTVKTLERFGVSAVTIEDKVGLKRNSLFGRDAGQCQDDLHVFAHKIAAGKAALVADEFMIVARIESLAVGHGIDDAMQRADAYIDAGADAIQISCADRDPKEFFCFSKAFTHSHPSVPLVCVPSTYPQVNESQLIAAGVRMVIYANQLLRSAYPAMVRTAESILRHRRAMESEDDCLPLQELLRLIPDRV